MRKATSIITVPHLSPIAVSSAESNSYIIALCFIAYETFQINNFNFLIFNNSLIQGV